MLSEELRAQGWVSIDKAPKDGTRVRVGHTLDPNSLKLDTLAPTYGAWDGEWSCNNAFVCIDGYLRWEPNVYKPETPDA